MWTISFSNMSHLDINRCVMLSFVLLIKTVVYEQKLKPSKFPVTDFSMWFANAAALAANKSWEWGKKRFWGGNPSWKSLSFD